MKWGELTVLRFLAFLIRWRGVQPSNERDWQPDVAVLPFARFDGDLVTIHNFD